MSPRRRPEIARRLSAVWETLDNFYDKSGADWEYVPKMDPICASTESKNVIFLKNHAFTDCICLIWMPNGCFTGNKSPVFEKNSTFTGSIWRKSMQFALLLRGKAWFERKIMLFLTGKVRFCFQITFLLCGKALFGIKTMLFREVFVQIKCNSPYSCK